MLYSARYIFTQNDTRDILENAALLVQDNKIIDLGPTATLLQKYPTEPHTPLGNAAIAPGLIDAHTHLPMSVLRGLGDDKALMAWLHEDIFPNEARLTPEILRFGTLLSLAELIRFGGTAFYDMYMAKDLILEVADRVGVRGIVGASVTQFFPSIDAASIADFEDQFRARADRWRNHPRLRIAVAPHATYTTNPELLKRLRSLADDSAALFMMHMAETLDEEKHTLESFGLRPLAYCDSLGILRSDTTLAHCVHLDDEDLDILRRTGAVPVHNPASNLKLASGLMPVQKLLASGLSVALGTDGPASNNAQNMLREMYLAAILSKFSCGDSSAFRAQDALDMATRHGAAALHDPSIGSLAPNQKADFIALDLSSPSLQPFNNPVSDLVFASSGSEVILTVVDGAPLYQNGKFLTLDYPGLLSELDSIRAWVKNKA